MLCCHGRQKKSVYDAGSRNSLSAVGKSGKAGPKPSFTKSVNKRKKRVESVDEANAFSLCYGRSTVLNDVLCWNCRIIACKNRKLNDSSRFLDDRGTFSESDDFSESSDKDSEFEARIKSKVSEDVEHIRIQTQRTVTTHKYYCARYEAQTFKSSSKQCAQI